MAVEQVIQHLDQPFVLDDSFYCEEEHPFSEMGDEDDAESCLDEELNSQNNITSRSKSSIFAPLTLAHGLFFEDEDLISLFTKEKEQETPHYCNPLACQSRRVAVEWILKMNNHFEFSASTAVYAVNYLDRFLDGVHIQKDKAWMIQLAAVTCLSLAAKVEETHVPLLLDLQQVEDANYVFEPKTIKRMELLVLSNLKWKMNPVTPLAFVEHIMRRLGLKNHLLWKFLRRCENLLLSILDDCRFVRYKPSILASATMLHIIHQVEPYNVVDHQNQLLHVLKLSKEKVNSCYELVEALVSSSPSSWHAHNNNPLKRKYINNEAAGRIVGSSSPSSSSTMKKIRA
ncbi:hypothetical protein Leryth_016035 [Lithospermum erythrorhizon]|nr:hypothetical protein Leryth_016035 [Lithospermum erythrorhizon]